MKVFSVKLNRENKTCKIFGFDMAGLATSLGTGNVGGALDSFRSSDSNSSSSSSGSYFRNSGSSSSPSGSSSSSSSSSSSKPKHKDESKVRWYECQRGSRKGITTSKPLQSTDKLEEDFAEGWAQVNKKTGTNEDYEKAKERILASNGQILRGAWE